MQKSIIRKGLVCLVIILFIGVSVTSSTGRIASVKTDIDDGSLLGYVNDTSGNPIEGALVRVYFHETYEEDYSDEDGYYHVTNIPICYCLKNVSCFKECYTTEWVLLSIVENTTHDFILNTTNRPPEEPTIFGPRNVPSETIKVIVKNPANYPPGKPIEFRFEAIDPDGDDIRYLIDWGDGSVEFTGFYPSGKEVKVNHTYNCEGTFTVEACAEDTCGFRGPWGTMSIPIWSISTEDSNDLVEITLQLCKTSGVEDHKMYITEEQEEQLDSLIESFKKDLDNTDTKAETIEIYKDMVISLDTLGILPEDLSCEEVQQLVTGENSISNPEMKSMKHFNQAFEKLKDKNSKKGGEENENCLIAGDTTNTTTIGLWSIFSGILGISLFALGTIIEILLEMVFLKFLRLPINWLIGIPALFLLISSILSYVFPLKFGGPMIFGNLYWPGIERKYHPAEGWVHTNGLNGIKTWNGSLYGNIKKIDNGFEHYYLGAVGFTGIKISPYSSGFFLGAASRVSLSHDPL